MRSVGRLAVLLVAYVCRWTTRSIDIRLLNGLRHTTGPGNSIRHENKNANVFIGETGCYSVVVKSIPIATGLA